MSGAAGRFSRHQLSIVSTCASAVRENPTRYRLIRGDHLAALSFFVAAGYRRVETLALVLVQLITVVDDGEIDLRPFRSVVGLVQLQPTLVNLRLELQHGL